jgi:hypothetical protein
MKLIVRRAGLGEGIAPHGDRNAFLRRYEALEGRVLVEMVGL